MHLSGKSKNKEASKKSIAAIKHRHDGALAKMCRGGETLFFAFLVCCFCVCVLLSVVLYVRHVRRRHPHHHNRFISHLLYKAYTHTLLHTSTHATGVHDISPVSAKQKEGAAECPCWSHAHTHTRNIHSPLYPRSPQASSSLSSQP
jgi:hypothetical protein